METSIAVCKALRQRNSKLIEANNTCRMDAWSVCLQLFDGWEASSATTYVITYTITSQYDLWLSMSHTLKTVKNIIHSTFFWISEYSMHPSKKWFLRNIKTCKNSTLSQIQDFDNYDSDAYVFFVSHSCPKTTTPICADQIVASTKQLNEVKKNDPGHVSIWCIWRHILHLVEYLRMGSS